MTQQQHTAPGFQQTHQDATRLVFELCLLKAWCCVVTPGTSYTGREKKNSYSVIDDKGLLVGTGHTPQAALDAAWHKLCEIALKV